MEESPSPPLVEQLNAQKKAANREPELVKILASVRVIGQLSNKR